MNSRSNANWDALLLCSGCPLKKILKEGFARVTGDDFAGGIAHPHDLLPILRRVRRSNRRADGDGDPSASREPSAVAQRAPDSIERDRHDFPLRCDSGFERAEMKWTHAGLRSKSSLRKYEYRFAAPQGFFDLFRLLQSRLRVFAPERVMAEFAKKRTEKRHGHHFGFGNEMIVRAERRHKHDDVRIACVIGDEHARRVSPQMLTAVDAHAPSGYFQVRTQRRRRDARRTSSRRRNQNVNPNGKHQHRKYGDGVASVRYFHGPPQRGTDASRARRRSQARDLQPYRRRIGSQRAGEEHLLRGVAAQLSARRFWDDIWRNDFDHVGGQS